MKFPSVIVVLIGVLGYNILQAQPLERDPVKSLRLIRSPTKHHKPLLGGLLFGGNTPIGHGPQGGVSGHGPQGIVNNNYVTNINNYGPGGHGGHGQEANFAGSVAFAGGHGGQSQSQAAAFSIGPNGASFSQSQAQSRHGKSGFFDLLDY
ncbi:uncharacterized protein LOC130895307 [Diorhabda carinulata]|uniref:uncharacterized protein LOC130895307 n=1 Tax=Diorhabda carinulata TaxID=1163345 RepID=UPI0025A2AF77|nr:uncharacterized protein LOC130895307 [Diorhabda carinulata]